MDDFEELDSFTQDLVRKTMERQKLLNEDSEDCHPFGITSNTSHASLDSASSIESKSNVMSNNDNKSNIMSNYDNNERIPRNDSKSNLINKLINISSDQKRVPLNQRLSSIARSYYSEDTENIDYMDNDFNDKKIVNENIENRFKPMKETEIHNKESQPKKRLLLNERLNAIARNFDDEELDVENDKTEYIAPVFTSEESKAFSSNREIHETSSTLKKKLLPIEEKSNEMKSDSPEKQNVSSGSPLKKKMLLSDEKDCDQSNRVEHEISDNKILSNKCVKQKLFGDDYNDDYNNDYNSTGKLIYNSNHDIIRQSINVSEVKKQFEQKNVSVKPENLSIKAKKDLFEKAILAENEAKSKQYGFVRKRIAPQQRIVDKAYNVPKESKQKESESKIKSTEETSFKRVKSSEKLSPNKNVSNNIQMRRQLLEQRLFATDSSTANSVMKDVENRKKELEILKRPFRQDNSQSIDYENTTVQYIPDNEGEEDSNIDNETAHQTICEAFEEIENLENQSLEQPDDDIFSANIDKKSPILKSSSSIKLEFGFGQNITENDEITGHGSQFIASPPPKPLRLYDASDSNTPLRTISFYRREQSQKSNNTTPVIQSISYKEKQTNRMNTDIREDRNQKIKERINQLKEDVDHHNRIASQASQALNLCLETNEFIGSTEQIEAERLLLVSGQKRIACLNEISKLKISLSDNVIETNATKGCLALHNIQLPVKGEFLVARAKGVVPEIHNFICLIYNGANVHVTDLMNSDVHIRNGKLDFSVGVYLKELSNDFTIRIQVYDLVTTSRHLPHDIKYHIKKKTPKKNKKGSMKSPSVRSPGGPNAVLSTSFSLIGAVNISLSNYSKNSFKLENFNFNSPLEGELFAKTELNVEHIYNKEGFFDIRDGTGFWNLRWFVLKGHYLSFWRFPDDVNTKPSLGSIDLKNCINPKVSILPSSMKHICMRPNTIALITIENRPKSVFTTGVTIPRSNAIKYLISGENKDDCLKWCELLTTVLKNIRLWESDAIRPYSCDEFDRLLMALE